MPPLTDDEIEQVRARLAAATNGEWSVHWEAVEREGQGDVEETYVVTALIDEQMVDVAELGARADAELVAHAKNDLGRLLDEVSRLRREHQ